MLIDTNVWSEGAKRSPDPKVIGWLDAHCDRAVLSTLVLGELMLGIALASDDVARDRLGVHLAGIRALVVTPLLVFDEQSARAWSGLTARLRRTGQPIGDLDTLIAAQALAHDLPVVTRNVRDFERTGVRLIDPWSAPA